MGLAHFLSTEHLVTNFCHFLVIQHQLEVALKSQRRPLSRGVMLDVFLLVPQPLFSPLQANFRFLHPPLPASPSAYLTVHFPCGIVTFPRGEIRAYHVPRKYQTNDLGFHPYADGETSTPGNGRTPSPDRLPFGSGVSTFWVSSIFRLS